MSLTPVKDLGAFEAPLLIFGGPYSNLAASSAMLQQAETLSIPPERIICNGDVVAYGAEPEQTTELIRQSGIHVVMGNCEESLAEGQADCGCGFEEGMLCSLLSANWYAYAQSRVSAVNRQWMGQLPRQITFTLNGRSCRVIHGAVDQINRFIFGSTDKDIKRRQLQLAKTDIIIGGHCGLPFGQFIDDRLWLNSGVIGLPANDGTSDGWYLLLQPVDRGIDCSWHRLRYDHQHCHQQMIAAGLTDYAHTILNGHWPSMDILPAQESTLQGTPLNPQRLFYGDTFTD